MSLRYSENYLYAGKCRLIDWNLVIGQPNTSRAAKRDQIYALDELPRIPVTGSSFDESTPRWTSSLWRDRGFCMRLARFVQALWLPLLLWDHMVDAVGTV